MDYPAEVDHHPTVRGIAATLRYIEEDFPSLTGVCLDRIRAGVLPFTSDHLPIVDEVLLGMIVAAGHVFGNSSGPMTWKLISQMLLGEELQIDMSDWRYDRELDPVVPGQIVQW